MHVAWSRPRLPLGTRSIGYGWGTTPSRPGTDDPVWGAFTVEADGSCWPRALLVLTNLEVNR